jgi:hypothetical protein
MSEVNHNSIPVIWSQLDVPVECPDPETGYPRSHLYFLHHRVGGDALDLDIFQQDSYMAPTGVRCRSWCTSLVSGEFCRKGIMVMFSSRLRCYGGHLHWHCTYPGRAKQDHTWGDRFGFGLEYLMLSKALVWEWSYCKQVMMPFETGIHTYIIVDINTPSCLYDLGLCTGHWFHLCNGRTSDCAESCGARQCLPRCCKIGLQ